MKAVPCANQRQCPFSKNKKKNRVKLVYHHSTTCHFFSPALELYLLRVDLPEYFYEGALHNVAERSPHVKTLI